MLHREQRDHIAHVLARTRDAGTAPAADVIERSWLRCVNDYGMDPTRQIPARIIEAGQLRERQDQVESFMRVARVGMEQLYKRVSSLGYVLLLTDAEGIAVDYIAHDALRAGEGADEADLDFLLRHRRRGRSDQCGEGCGNIQNS